MCHPRRLLVACLLLASGLTISCDRIKEPVLMKNMKLEPGIL